MSGTRPGGTPEHRRSPWRRWRRLLLLLVGAAALYGLAPQIFDVWGEAPRIGRIGVLGLVAMVVFEGCSYVAAWRLHRVALPGLSWFAAGTTQLTANAVSRSVPGGAAVGAGVSVRMWTIAGVAVGQAGAALAATSIISTGTLLALPIVSLLVAAVGAPIPQHLAGVALGGAAMSVALFSFGAVVVTSERAAAAMARLAERTVCWVLRRFGRNGPSADDLLQHRAELVEALGPRWRAALAAAVANWGFDYLALVAALVALDTNPRFSLVLLAYGAAAVLAMIPVTPGGLGFVEAGLTSLLVVAGVPASEALLATLAYRIVSYWLPLPTGVVAWLLFRRRFHQPLGLEDLDPELREDGSR